MNFKKLMTGILCACTIAAFMPTEINAQANFVQEHISYATSSSYGETMWIGNAGIVPSGWVIIKTTSSGRLIKCLIGAEYGETEWIVQYSAIPSGWVITRTTPSGGRLIKCLNGAKYGDTQWVISYSSIPSGWIIIRTTNSGKLIKYIG